MMHIHHKIKGLAFRQRRTPRRSVALGMALLAGVTMGTGPLLSTPTAQATIASINDKWCGLPTVSVEKPQVFDGKKLLALSDATMPASGFMDGKLNPGDRIKRTDKDTLTALGLPLNVGRPRDPSPTAGAPVVGEVEAENSAVGPPFVVTASADGNRAYVLRTRGNPPQGTTEVGNVLEDLPAEALITVVDISNTAEPQVIQTLPLGINDGQSISLSPDGTLLAVNTPATNRNIILYHVLPDGRVGAQAAAIHGSDPNTPVADVGRVQWHPSGKYLSNTLQMADEVRFYKLNKNGDNVSMSQWGNAVKVGKYPAEGTFTPDGKYYMTTDLQWGEDVPGFSDDPPAGTVTAVRFDAERGQHRKTGQAQTDVNPEGIGVSPDGRYIVTANLIRSFYPWDRERLTAESSINLLELDQRSGKLKTIQRVAVDGILPEGVVFDKSGDNLAISVFDQFDPRYRRGAVKFYEFVRQNKPGCASAAIIPTNVEMEVAPGPHVLWLVR